jgi:hypothetical protein
MCVIMAVAGAMENGCQVSYRLIGPSQGCLEGQPAVHILLHGHCGSALQRIIMRQCRASVTCAVAHWLGGPWPRHAAKLSSEAA